MRKPIKIDCKGTELYHSAQKQILGERLLDIGDSEEKWEICGGYSLIKQDEFDTANQKVKVPYSLAREVPEPYPGAKRFGKMYETVREGRPVIRLESETQTDTPNMYEPGRDWTAIILKRRFDGEDWTEFNRIAVDVYADFPGFYNVAMGVILYNEGEEKLPNDKERDGIHFINIKNHDWTTVYLEIPDMGREKVTGIGFQYRLKGHEACAGGVVSYDFCNLRLQKVVPEVSHGWYPSDKNIVYSYSGYLPGMEKIAISKTLDEKEFKLEAENGDIVYTGLVRQEVSSIGTFDVLDFTEFSEKGKYRIVCGESQTDLFEIGNKVLQSSIEKVLNFFYCLRCGYRISGSHGVCHEDSYCEHNGIRVHANGGWHDAGDLSQGSGNTADSISALILAAEMEGKNGKLHDDLLDEAMWGMDWLLKTRFGDGYRLMWITSGIYTEGFTGDIDDNVAEANNDSASNYCCTRAEALGAIYFKKEDAVLAERCLVAAEADFAFAEAVEEELTKRHGERISLLGQKAVAAMYLFELTGKEKYDFAIKDSIQKILECQKTEADEIELVGYFYTNPAHEHILSFPHRSSEDSHIRALSMFVERNGETELGEAARAALESFAKYIKSIVKYTAPYEMLPAFIYDTRDLPDSAPAENAERQVKNGIQLSEHLYLRRFPVWYAMRGNTGTTLTLATGLYLCADVLKDNDLKNIVYHTLEWHLGRNPFGRSMIYGEGKRYNDMYSTTSGNIVGAMPVGVRTLHDEDVPYYPMANYCNWNEVWIHSASRWMELASRFNN